MVFNATSNNISDISWRSVSLVEKTGVLGENRSTWRKPEYLEKTTDLQQVTDKRAFVFITAFFDKDKREDTKSLVRSRVSRKHRYNNGQRKESRKTNNDPQKKTKYQQWAWKKIKYKQWTSDWMCNSYSFVYSCTTFVYFI